MPASSPETSSNAPFPTTRWSQVVAAGERAGPAAREALAELCSAYWYPLYAFVRRKGHPPDEAADLVQGTFLSILDRNGLAAVAPERGRFRSGGFAVSSFVLCFSRAVSPWRLRGVKLCSLFFQGGFAVSFVVPVIRPSFVQGVRPNFKLSRDERLVKRRSGASPGAALSSRGKSRQAEACVRRLDSTAAQ